MKWAIVFYAILAPLGGTDTEEIISWGLTFKHHEECIQFYNKNNEQIIKGLQGHADEKFGHPMHLLELGCAHAVADFENVPTENRDANVTLHVPLYNGGEQT